MGIVSSIIDVGTFFLHPIDTSTRIAKNRWRSLILLFIPFILLHFYDADDSALKNIVMALLFGIIVHLIAVSLLALKCNVLDRHHINTKKSFIYSTVVSVTLVGYLIALMILNNLQFKSKFFFILYKILNSVLGTLLLGSSLAISYTVIEANTDYCVE